MSHYKSGTWNYICPVCGFLYKADEVRRRWDGVYVCNKDWEPRHESEFLRPRGEHNHVTFVNEDAEATITITTSVTEITVTVLDESDLPISGKTIVPSSSDTNIATVGNVSGATDGSGQATFDITPVNIGTTYIVVTVDGVASNVIPFEVAGS